MKQKKDISKRRIEMDLFKMIVFVVLLVAIFFAAGKVFQEFNNVEYKGLDFTKERIGDTGLFKYSYYLSGVTGNVVNYNLYLKTDPRINDIEVGGGGEITFPHGKTAYISTSNSELADCLNSTAAIATMAGFLNGNQILVRGASNDFFEANRGDYKYVTCENKPDRAVIMFSRGEETKILINGLCYDIIVGPQCDIWQAVEKFEVETILTGKERMLL